MHYTYLRAGILASEGQLQNVPHKNVLPTGLIDKSCGFMNMLHDKVQSYFERRNIQTNINSLFSHVS